MYFSSRQARLAPQSDNLRALLADQLTRPDSWRPENEAERLGCRHDAKSAPHIR